MKRLMGLLISGALIAGSAGYTFAQEGVKQTTKDVAKGTKRAAKKTGKVVAKTTKKVVKKGATVTRKGAAKVKGKTDTKK